jgi:hypothetical protein
MNDIPAPEGTKAAGQQLWDSVLETFDLEEHELLILRQAVHTADLIEAMKAELGDKLLADSGAKVHPLIPELRLQRVTLGRLLAALRVPLSDDSEQNRPQRRAPFRAGHPATLKPPKGLRIAP